MDFRLEDHQGTRGASSSLSNRVAGQGQELLAQGRPQVYASFSLARHLGLLCGLVGFNYLNESSFAIVLLMQALAQSLLVRGIRAASVSLVERSLAMGADVNRIHEGATLLPMAVKKGHVAIVK